MLKYILLLTFKLYFDQTQSHSFCNKNEMECFDTDYLPIYFREFNSKNDAAGNEMRSI